MGQEVYLELASNSARCQFRLAQHGVVPESTEIGNIQLTFESYRVLITVI